MKFLIDECLSPKLADLAHARGYGESSHVVWLGRTGAKDWELVRFVAVQDWTLVTCNSFDFRGTPSRPERGLYSTLYIHAGLICLNGPEGMNRALQLELFEHAIEALESSPDLVKQVLEVSLLPDDRISVIRYALPAS